MTQLGHARDLQEWGNLLHSAGRIHLRSKGFRATHQHLGEVDADGRAHPIVVPKGSISSENLL